MGRGFKMTRWCINPNITAWRQKNPNSGHEIWGMKFGACKTPSPIPTTPPTPRDFILYTVSTSTTLLEFTNFVFSSYLFIHACKSEKKKLKRSVSVGLRVEMHVQLCNCELNPNPYEGAKLYFKAWIRPPKGWGSKGDPKLSKVWMLSFLYVLFWWNAEWFWPFFHNSCWRP